MSEATEIASMGITTMIELMQSRDEIKRLKEQLAKQEQGEPVGECITKGVIRWNKSYPEVGTKLYTTPQQPKQEQGEPVAWLLEQGPHVEFEHMDYHDGVEWTPLYTTPQQRKPLTDEQLKAHIQIAMKYYGYDPTKYGPTTTSGFVWLARAIEAAHGIKE